MQRAVQRSWDSIDEEQCKKYTDIEGFASKGGFPIVADSDLTMAKASICSQPN
jgi:hypothetical protein